MSKEIKVTVVEASEIDNYNDEEGFTFKHPSKFYVLTSPNFDQPKLVLLLDYGREYKLVD